MTRPLAERLQTAMRKAGALMAARDKAGWVRDELKWRRFYARLEAEDRLNAEFDAKYGTDTAGEILLAQTGVTAAQAAGGNDLYRALWASDFEAALALILGPREPFTFIDIGSGKGKLLLLASAYPFRRIIGVEYAPALHETAARNVAAYRAEGQKCHDITALLGDATTYALPDEPLILLVFNAMQEAVMRRALANMEAAPVMGRHPVYLIYLNMREVSEIGAALDGLTVLRPVYRDRTRVVLANALAREQYAAGVTGG